MSETIGVNVARRAYNAEISPQFDGYSGVRILVGTDDDGNAIVYESGNTTGRTLEINNTFGTQAMADNILAEIQGYQYQPLSAESALLNPAAEMGDGLTVNGVYTGLFTRSTQFGRLMASDISAPTDEEIAHEYATDTATTDRAYTRFVRATRASLSINSQEIASEVARATEAEGELSSDLTQTASEIRAEVTAVDNSKLNHTRSNSSFGWKLDANGFYLNSSGNRNVFTANSSGIKIQGNAEVTGKITATSGFIGNGSNGFTINSTSITNGKTSISDANNGIYVGTNGIGLGANGKFKVDNYGNVIASSLTINGGSINIGNKFMVDSSGNLTASSGTFTGNVYAGNIQYGGNAGYFNGGGIGGGTVGLPQLNGYCGGGIGGGVNFNNMEYQSRAAYIYARGIFCLESGTISGNHVGKFNGASARWAQLSIPSVSVNYGTGTVYIYYGGRYVGSGSYTTTSVYTGNSVTANFFVQ